jgi:hypothetical protein
MADRPEALEQLDRYFAVVANLHRELVELRADDAHIRRG